MQLPSSERKKGFEVDESVSFYETTFPDVVSLEKLVPQRFWNDAQRVRIMMLGEAMSALLKPLNWVVKSGSKISMEIGETQKCFLMIMSYCWNVFCSKGYF